MTVKVFDRKQYSHRQIIEALTCPINRHGTREEHKCDDWELFLHPDWLIAHYTENGGAVEFAKRRAEFTHDEDVPDEVEYLI